MKTQTWKSPLGRIYLAANESGLTALAFDSNWPKIKPRLGELEKGDHKFITQAISELEEYFSGKRKTFSVPLVLQGTPFQKSAWTALMKIPYGKTASYGEQAVKIRRPRAIRAVGRANGLNPIGIFVPCHRVIGASGALTGYAGGLKAKKALLALEGAGDLSED
ncbi:MAG: methylated-DNA--[protein]-cysteine S-methyltransferase [Bdellovibrionota bacterium]